MSRFALRSGEHMIGSGHVSLKQRQGLFWGMFHGELYVTDQRVCFFVKMTGSMVLDLPLTEIKGYTAGYSFFLTAVRIYGCDGNEYKITGAPAKEVQEWLRRAGVVLIENDRR